MLLPHVDEHQARTADESPRVARSHVLRPQITAGQFDTAVESARHQPVFTGMRPLPIHALAEGSRPVSSPSDAYTAMPQCRVRGCCGTKSSPMLAHSGSLRVPFG